MPKVWLFHQVKNFKKNCFMRPAGYALVDGSDAISPGKSLVKRDLVADRSPQGEGNVAGCEEVSRDG